MTVAILAIGTELSRGDINNGNGRWLAEELTNLGHEVTEITIVDDDLERLCSLLERLGRSHCAIVATGGLGPTTDDLTRDAVAKTLNVPLERHGAAYSSLEARLLARGRSVTASNARQAMLPQGSTLLPNPHGTAPGFAVNIGMAAAFFMPGVPREMRPMFEQQVVPRLPLSVEPPGVQIVLRVYGMMESAVGEALAGIESKHGVLVAYQLEFPELKVKILARDASAQAAEARARAATLEVAERLGARHVYAEGSERLPSVVGELLRKERRTLALAESCTGGLLAELLTQGAGASDYFLGSAVSYANEAKTALLGVPPALILEFGAVSDPVAVAMATGIRQKLGADYALSVTGIAGPSGGSTEKPVGLVYIALSSERGTIARRYQLFGDRAEIQGRAAWSALAWLRERLLGLEETS